MKLNRLTRNATILGAALVLALLCTVVALAAAGYSLFGNAQLVSPGNNSPTAVQLSSTCPGGPSQCFANNTFTYSGVDFAVPTGLTVASLNNLSTDYNFSAGGCGGGSPRFQVNVTNGSTSGNIFMYIGPPPNYSPCALGIWLNSGNLAAPANLVDTSQLPAGAFYDPYAVAQSKYGSYQVTGIQLVADGAWALGPGYNQTLRADNVAINDSVTTFESKDSCKDGGWQQFTAAPGPFKNQGQCVSYFAKGGQ
jgi:hypothetical protein